MSAIVVQCDCGAKYKIDTSAIGRRVRCKKCAGTFVVGQGQGAPARPTAKSSGPASAGAAAAALLPSTPAVTKLPPAASAVAPPAAVGYADMSEGGGAVDRSMAGLIRSLLASFLFFRRARNIGTFLLAWGLLVAGNIGSGLLFSLGNFWVSASALLAFVLAEGSFAAFSFDTICRAADSEDELPAFPLAVGPEDWWDLLIKPFFAFAGTCGLVLVPAIVFSTVASVLVMEDPSIPSYSGMIGVCGLAAIGLFLWPMAILCVAIGGFDALLRVGRMITSILRTFFPYACTVLMVYLSAGAWIFVIIYLDSASPYRIVVVVLAYGVRVFLQTAAMRAIGAYYYRHYEQLAWIPE